MKASVTSRILLQLEIQGAFTLRKKGLYRVRLLQGSLRLTSRELALDLNCSILIACHTHAKSFSQYIRSKIRKKGGIGTVLCVSKSMKLILLEGDFANRRKDSIDSLKSKYILNTTLLHI